MIVRVVVNDLAVAVAVGGSGVWEAFVPGVGSGASYKFVVEGADGVWRHKADPMAFFAEHLGKGRG